MPYNVFGIHQLGSDIAIAILRHGVARHAYVCAGFVGLAGNIVFITAGHMAANMWCGISSYLMINHLRASSGLDPAMIDGTVVASNRNYMRLWNIAVFDPDQVSVCCQTIVFITNY
jgi:hypothetical protein